MDRVRQSIKPVFLLAAGVFFDVSLVFAAEPKGIVWKDYAQATAAAQKAHKPVLIDFWRPG